VYKIEEKLHLGARVPKKRLNTTALSTLSAYFPEGLMKTINVDQNQKYCDSIFRGEYISYKCTLNAFRSYGCKYAGHATESGPEAEAVNSKTQTAAYEFMCGSKAGTSPPEKLKTHTSIKDQRSLKKDFIQLFLFIFFFAREYFLSTRILEEGLRFAEAL
jgi:hypothetical protein